MIRKRRGRGVMYSKKISVKDLMNPDVKTADESTKLLSAAKMMRNQGVSSLIIEPICDGDAYGIITRKDIVEVFVQEGVEGNGLLVEWYSN